MIDPTLQARVDEFWCWFGGNHKSLDPYQFDQGLMPELEAHLSGLGEFDWEIGVLPGESGKTRYFALSPRGSLERLSDLKVIVSCAPSLKGWTFCCGKPAKPEPLEIILQGENGDDFELDASSWEYVVYKNPDSSIDVVFKPDLDLDVDLEALSIIILDNILGEEQRLLAIRGIEIKRAWNEREMEAARSLGSSPITEVLRPRDQH